MSFGWSVGDIFVAVKILFEIGKALSDVNGAPQHFRETAALFPPIRFELRKLGMLIKQYHHDWRSENGQGSLLEEVDINDFKPVISQLKLLVGQLCDTLAKGADMGLNSKPSLREWPKAQLRKLQWHFLEKEGIDALIQKIYRQTQHIQSFYLAVNT